MDNNINTNTEEEKIPECVIEAFWQVRDTGLVNMFDGTGVVKVMLNEGLHEAAGWLIDFKHGRADIKKYARLLTEIRESTEMLDKLRREGN